jgi:putative ABC transport system substrate-binding protein
MPAMYFRREFAEAGGLACYGTSVVDPFRQVGLYVARILNGDKPGELPVMQAAKFEFVLNLKTARALGHRRADGFFGRRRRNHRIVRDVADWG